jgi:hypothetical protein
MFLHQNLISDSTVLDGIPQPSQPFNFTPFATFECNFRKHKEVLVIWALRKFRDPTSAPSFRHMILSPLDIFLVHWVRRKSSDFRITLVTWIFKESKFLCHPK